MPGMTQAEAQATLDQRFPTTGGTDYVGWSTNGTTEATGVLARVAVGATGWAPATAAQPSVKANASPITSAAGLGSGLVSHFAIFTAPTGGVQRTDWQALDTPQTVNTSTTLTWPAGALKINLD